MSVRVGVVIFATTQGRPTLVKVAPLTDGCHLTRDAAEDFYRLLCDLQQTAFALISVSAVLIVNPAGGHLF